MGKPKRVIVWEGDTSNLPNRNEKKNIVYANPKLDMSACIECYEDPVNPSSPYRINFPRNSIKTVSNSLQNAKFSIEVIRDVLENNEDALVVFCYPSKYDGSINNDINTNFTHKTYEQLGIQDLYEEYLEQSK